MPDKLAPNTDSCRYYRIFFPYYRNFAFLIFGRGFVCFCLVGRFLRWYVSIKTKLFLLFSTILCCLFPYQMAKILPPFCCPDVPALHIALVLSFVFFSSKFVFLWSFKSFQETLVEWLSRFTLFSLSYLHLSSLNTWRFFIAAFRWGLVGAKELNLTRKLTR